MKQPIQLLDVYFFNKLCSGRESYINPCVAEAIQYIHKGFGNIRIKNLQKQVHTSQRTLERMFLNQLGLSAKTYSRLLRYNRAKSLIDADTVNWQNLCFDLGYFDQAHFIKEFKMYSGLSPEVYIAKEKTLANVF